MREGQRARVARPQREVAKDDACALGVQALMLDRAARAGQVGVEDDDGAPAAADVVVLADGRHRGAAQVLHPDSLAAMEDLRGDGIVIRRFREHDAEAFAPPRAIRRSSRTPGCRGRYTPTARARCSPTTTQAADFIQRAIADTQTDELLGTVILFNFARHEARCEVGFWLVPGGRGRGAATTAVGLACDWAVRSWGIERFDAHSDVDNPRAHAVLERNGFSREGVLRGWGARGAERVDAVHFGRLTPPE